MVVFKVQTLGGFSKRAPYARLNGADKFEIVDETVRLRTIVTSLPHLSHGSQNTGNEAKGSILFIFVVRVRQLTSTHDFTLWLILHPLRRGWCASIFASPTKQMEPKAVSRLTPAQYNSIPLLTIPIHTQEPIQSRRTTFFVSCTYGLLTPFLYLAFDSSSNPRSPSH